MDAHEFAALAHVDGEHWFYRGKRDIVRHWIDRLALLAADDVVLDVGAGTGQLVAELGRGCRAVGIEWHPDALALAASKRVPLVRGAMEHLPIGSGRAAVVTALDVLEHVDDDAAGLGELVRVARPGGLLILHVPAFPMLWSAWDEALGHRRRYTRRTLLALVGRFPLTLRRCVYLNSAAFVPILLYRALRDRLGLRVERRLEDVLPPPAVNRLLRHSFVGPACWPWFSPPFGVSLLCIAEKRGGPIG